jgi:membrane fusion protein (multidrug efflux system)
MSTVTSPKARWALAVAGLLAVVAALGGIKAMQIGSMIKAGKSFAPPLEAVTSAKAERVEWESGSAAVGTLVAMRATVVGAEVPGTVREVAYASGQTVKRGDLLIRLDTSTEEAQLVGATADATLAHIKLERTRTLFQRGGNTQAELDEATGRAALADATVANLKALVAKKTLRAPFDGRIAIRQVELGQVVSPGTPIASLQSVTPIYAEFWMPQQALAELKVDQRVRVHTDIFSGRSWEGTVSVINPEVDVATRNVRVRATLLNEDGLLTPGMFVNVEVLSSEKSHVVAVPATAIFYAPYGDSVFTLEEKKDDQGKVSTVAQRKFVRLGEHRGDFVVVASGLAGGEMVVSNGAFKLRNGAAVAVDNALAPTNEMLPRPAEK